MLTHLTTARTVATALIAFATIAACGSEDLTSTPDVPAETVAAITTMAIAVPQATSLASTAPSVPPAGAATSSPATLVPGTTVPPATPPASTVPPAAPIRVLVTNDDGYSAEGIDRVVEALRAFDVPVFDVTVVAPLVGQDGQGGTVTDGPVAATDVTTLSGYPAIAVDGFPADAVRWALDEGGIGFIPDFVISGIDEGQSLGPFVDTSGTVGAARAAAARNVQSIAISSGTATVDYDAAVKVLQQVLANNLATLLAHEPGAPVQSVISVNVPSCSTGEVRGLIGVPLSTDLQGFDLAADVDCATTSDNPADDVQAFFSGFAPMSPVPLEPVSNA